MKPRT